MNIRSWNIVVTEFNLAIISWPSWYLALRFRKRKLRRPSDDTLNPATREFKQNTTQYNTLYESVSTICVCYALRRNQSFNYAKFLPDGSTVFRGISLSPTNVIRIRKMLPTKFCVHLFVLVTGYVSTCADSRHYIRSATWISNQQHLRVTKLHNRYLKLRSNQFRLVFIVR